MTLKNIINFKNIFFGIIGFLAIKNILPAIAVKINSIYAKQKLITFMYDHVIDIRTEKQRKTGYHLYSMNIPFDNLQILSSKIVDKYKKILIISNNGNQSEQAANIITKMGYRNVEYLNDTWTKLI